MHCLEIRIILLCKFYINDGSKGWSEGYGPLTDYCPLTDKCVFSWHNAVLSTSVEFIEFSRVYA